jgi:rubrerythrin
MLSKNVVNTKKISTEKTDIESIRLAIVGELDAINLYEQIAESTNNAKIKKVLLDIAKEEKVHIGELQKLLDEFDLGNKSARDEGEQEVQELNKEKI